MIYPIYKKVLSTKHSIEDLFSWIFLSHSWYDPRALFGPKNNSETPDHRSGCNSLNEVKLLKIHELVQPVWLSSTCLRHAYIYGMSIQLNLVFQHPISNSLIKACDKYYFCIIYIMGFRFFSWPLFLEEKD